MSGLVAYLMLAIFFGGVTLGVVAVLAVAIHKEGKYYNLPDTPGYRAALTFREILKKPGETSVISRTPKGALVVDDNDTSGRESSLS
jgi:hypothetical protein